MRFSMRFAMMRPWLAGAALAAAAASAAHAMPPAQVVCTAAAEGESGQRIEVSIHVEPDGQVVASYAAWYPPLERSSGIGGPDQPDLGLFLSYDNVSAAGIGPVGGATVVASAVAPFDKRVSGTALAKRLDRLTGQVAADGAAPIAVQLAPGPGLEELPGIAIRFGTFGFATSPRLIEVSLRDPKGKAVVTSTYRLSGIAQRDALYAQAWKAADAASRNPDSCEPTAAP